MHVLMKLEQLKNNCSVSNLHDWVFMWITYKSPWTFAASFQIILEDSFLKQTNKQVNTLKEKAKNAIIFPIVISNVTGFAFKGEAGTVYFKAQSTSDVQKEFMSNVCESENTYPLPFN